MPTRLDLTLREYDAVFAELRQSIALQYSILGIGFVVLGGILKAAWDSFLKPDLPTTIFLGLIATGADLLVLTAWVAEVTRMRRNAMYLIVLERDLLAATSEINDPTSTINKRQETQFGFHTWASAQRQGQLVMNYVLLFCLLCATGAIGFAPTALVLFDRHLLHGSCPIPDCGQGKALEFWINSSLAGFGVFIAILLLFARRLYRIDVWPVPSAIDKQP